MSELSKILPVLSAVLLCDTAATDPVSHKKSLIGIFDRMYVGKFPASRPIRVYVRLADAQGQYNLTIRLAKAADASALAEVKANFTVVDRRASTDFVVPTYAYPFPEAGLYEFQVIANDSYLGAAALNVELMPERERPGGQA